METANSIIRHRVLYFVAFILVSFSASAAQTFTIATYNVDTYLDQPTQSRPHVKTAEAKAQVRKVIHALNPDILALEEMGSTNALLELRGSLKSEGLDYPYWEHVSGWDTNIHVAVLSKFPFVASHPHINDEFLLDGRIFHVSRGFAELEIQPAPGFAFTLIAVHLKSKVPDSGADPDEQRYEEAKVLRHIIDQHLHADPDAKLVVLGDFNDEKDSDSLREIIGRGKSKLVDTRPAERNGDNVPSEPPYYEPRNVTWTYFYGKDDTYSRIDYILLSPAMARDWVKAGTYASTVPNWGIASDHRPIIAAFETGN
ncbi:MAG TPA: endonuclease/exonuclease/phosphatase family protein [Candidatus Acidoferrales bacterium]|nr:endonuclease/exonuclease/phosphatase family protein [Candidatus Acidoferrales bacterium]